MKTIAQILAVPIIVLGLGSCNNQPKEVPNLGFVDIGEGTAHDVDNDLQVDGILSSDGYGNAYLSAYVKGYENDSAFKEYFDSNKSEIMLSHVRDSLSKELRLNNERVYNEEMFRKIEGNQ